MSSELQPLRGLRRSQARLRHSLLHWGLRTGLRFAGPVFRGCGALRAVLTPSPLRGFDGFGLFRALRAAFVRPAYGDPVFRRFAPPSPSAARCSGAADAFWACPRASSRFAAFACALRVLAPPAASRPPTASGRDGNAFLRFAPTLNSAWSSHTFAPPCANACAVFRPCGLRFAPCPRGSSRFAASDARRLACGTPCFIGLTSRCFVPQFAIVALLRYRLQVSFAHWTSASPVPRTARGEAPSHRARASCAPAVHAAGDDCTAKRLRLSRAFP